MKNKIAREKKRNGNDKDEKVKAAYQGLLDQAYNDHRHVLNQI
jgi:hypothetical protein